jgi:hypothetical protein
MQTTKLNHPLRQPVELKIEQDNTIFSNYTINKRK